MKKLIFILAIIAMFSCEKAPVQCYTCYKYTKISNHSTSVLISQDRVLLEQFCEFTEEEMHDYHSDHYYFTSTPRFDIGANVYCETWVECPLENEL